MFRKFKDKLAEEMKQSPARLQASMQQFAQAVVSPALSNSSIQELTGSNDNFSLTEEGDETPKNSPAKHGFHDASLMTPTINSMGISRRSSVSSVTSDTSSLFPVYESPQNLYHLQSDMDQSASEVDENISPQLDRVTKDQLYSAYRNVLAKYHKYRGRYTDLASHYRELERVKMKLESVLVETQDKVVRRVADLKEQCQLEQQAKAHLEEALRNDIEEKDHIIDTLNTKVRLLQNNIPPSVDNILESGNPDQTCNSKTNLIDLHNESTSNPNVNSSLTTENDQLREKFKKLENVVLKYKESLKRNKEKFTELMEEKNLLQTQCETLQSTNREKLQSLQQSLTAAHNTISGLTVELTTLKKQEEESVISLAENKLSIYRELEDKEEQIKQLRQELKQVMEHRDHLSETVKKHQAELEQLQSVATTQNTLMEGNDIAERDRHEIPETVSAENHTKDDLVSSLSVENVASQTLQQDLVEKEHKLKDLMTKLKEFQKKYDTNESDRAKLQTELSNLQIQYKELQNETDAQKIVTEEKQKENITTIEKLQVTIHNLDKELENMRNALTDRDGVCEAYNAKIQEYAAMLQTANEQLVLQSTEMNMLKNKLENSNQVSQLTDVLDKKERELHDLHHTIEAHKSTISHLENELDKKTLEHDLLSKQRILLVDTLSSCKDNIFSLKADYIHLKTGINKEFMQQYKAILDTNVTLTTLFVQMQQNEKDLKHEIGNLQKELLNYEELKIQCTQLKDHLNGSLQLKSELENNLMEHMTQLNQAEKRLEKYDQIEKRNNELMSEVDNLNSKIETLVKLQDKVDETDRQMQSLTAQLEILKNVELANVVLTNELEDLRESTQSVKFVQMEIDELRAKNEEAKNIIESLNSKITEHAMMKKEVDDLKSETILLQENIYSKDTEIKCLYEKYLDQEKHGAALEHAIEKNNQEINDLTTSNKTLQDTINTKNLQLKKLKALKERQAKSLQEKLQELETAKKEIEIYKTEINQVETLKKNNSLLTTQLEQLQIMKDQIASENKDLKDKQNILLKTNDELIEAKEIIKKEIRNHEVLVQQLTDNINTLHVEIETYKNELNTQHNDLKNLTNQISEMQSSISSKDEELKLQSENLEMQKRTLQQFQENLTSETKIRNEKILELTETNKSLLADNQKLKIEIEDAQNVRAENGTLKVEIQKIKGEMASVEKVQIENAVYQDNLEKRTNELENVNSNNVILQAHIDDLTHKILTLEAQEHENQQLKTELKTLKDNENILTTKLSELTGIAEKKTEELKLVDIKNQDLLEEIEKINSLSAQAIAERLKEVESLKGNVNKLEQTITELQIELRSSKAILENKVQLSETNTTVAETVLKNNDRLQEENKKLEAQLDEALITFQAKESQMQILNSELKTKMDKLKEELKMHEEEQSMRLKQLVKEFQAQLQDKEEELQAALEKRFDSHKNYESDLIQQYKEQLKDFQIELTAKSEQIENVMLENKDTFEQKDKEINNLIDTIAEIKKEHANEIKEIERKWKGIVQQRREKLEMKHEEEVNELTKEWCNERRNSAENNTHLEELESTSRVAMAAVQSNTGSFHTLQQTLASQRRELTELRKLVKIRYDSVEDSTEIEYLKNILYEYMMGKQTMVLAKVIAAVVKFDQQQTAKILKKEEDKLTLLGSLGLT